MDQERDTTDNARSSRRGRFWLENAPADAEMDENSKRVRPSARQAAASFEEISPQEAAQADPIDEAFPTLFELPDRTPEALRKKRESSQFAIHDRHSGPPANHVDPPSGDHSHLGPIGPNAPNDSDRAAPRQPPQADPSPAEPAPTSESATDFEPPAIAARYIRFDEQSAHEPATTGAAVAASNPATATVRTAWSSRSAIVMSVLAMVTLAFFTGRGLHQWRGPSEDPTLSDADLGDLDETIVIITEDTQGAEALADSIISEPPSYIAQAPVPDELDDLAKVEEIAATVEPTKAGELGQPTASVSLDNTIAATLASENMTSEKTPELPAAIEPNESVVAFRANESENTDSKNTAATSTDIAANDDALPQGMDSRLRLEDGLRYSDTPHAIGNFLEILKAWEASEQKP